MNVVKVACRIQWCRENNINGSTFYNWVNKLRDMACQETMIESTPNRQVTPARQDIVRVNILPKDEQTSVITQNRPVINTESVSIELILNGCSIKIYIITQIHRCLLIHSTFCEVFYDRRYLSRR